MCDTPEDDFSSATTSGMVSGSDLEISEGWCVENLYIYALYDLTLGTYEEASDKRGYVIDYFGCFCFLPQIS